MLFTVHWIVNDGRCGYPNIVADLSWSDQECKSYEEAIRSHAKQKDVNNLFNVSATYTRGKINGRCYRDFFVQYVAKNITENKALYIDNECVSKTIRVFGKQSL